LLPFAYLLQKVRREVGVAGAPRPVGAAWGRRRQEASGTSRLGSSPARRCPRDVLVAGAGGRSGCPEGGARDVLVAGVRRRCAGARRGLEASGGCRGIRCRAAAGRAAWRRRVAADRVDPTTSGRQGYGRRYGVRAPVFRYGCVTVKRTALTEIWMEDVTESKYKSSGTKLAFSKVRGRNRPFDKSSGTNSPILPFFNYHQTSEAIAPVAEVNGVVTCHTHHVTRVTRMR
jgi:hypothetical protein